MCKYMVFSLQLLHLWIRRKDAQVERHAVTVVQRHGKSMATEETHVPAVATE
jgi:hypothetical protein